MHQKRGAHTRTVAQHSLPVRKLAKWPKLACDKTPWQEVHDAARGVCHPLPLLFTHLPLGPIPVMPIHPKGCVLTGHTNEDPCAASNILTRALRSWLLQDEDHGGCSSAPAQVL